MYEGLASRGIGPRQADELYLWEIAGIFGAHRPDRQRGGGGSAASGFSGPAPEPGGVSELMKARIAHAKDPENNPLPEAQPTDPSAITSAVSGFGEPA